MGSRPTEVSIVKFDFVNRSITVWTTQDLTLEEILHHRLSLDCRRFRHDFLHLVRTEFYQQLTALKTQFLSNVLHIP